jgi:glycoprotein endo-alpha-1,2-mannosidase
MKTCTHIIGSAVLAAVLAVSTQAEDSPRVFAHYMPWFRAEPRANGSIEWDHWQWYGKGRKHDPDTILENGRRDIASVFYPMIGPYDGRDPAVLEYHMLTAKAAGIEGFIADWYGPNTYADIVFSEMTKTAERYGMKVCICLEEKAFFPGYSKAETRGQVQDVMEQHIRHVLEKYGHSPAYHQVNGKPVFFIFNNFQDGILGQHILRPDELAPVLDRFKDSPIMFVRGYFNPAYDALVRAGYVWCGDAKTREEFYSTGTTLRAEGRLDYWVGLANPGFNDTGVNGWGNGSRVTERRGTAEFQDHWNEVLKYKPDAVQIATWNDFEEGTTIEPAEEYGFTFVNETEKNVQRFTGRTANINDNPWPLRIYHLRKMAASLDDEAKAHWNQKLDSFAQDFAQGKRFLMGLRLWYLELRINKQQPTKEGQHEKVE